MTAGRVSVTELQRRQMQREFGLHELAVEDARHGHQRPKVEEYVQAGGDMLFTVVHTLEGQARDPQVGELAVRRRERCLDRADPRLAELRRRAHPRRDCRRIGAAEQVAGLLERGPEVQATVRVEWRVAREGGRGGHVRRPTG